MHYKLCPLAQLSHFQVSYCGNCGLLLNYTLCWFEYPASNRPGNSSYVLVCQRNAW